MHILVATDADHVVDDVTAALGGPDVSFTVCRNGRDVSGVVQQRQPDLVVLDLQSGSMGAMAVTMSLRLDESASNAVRSRVLMLLDRQSDVHLARRCDADGWIIKPLDPMKIKRAVRTILEPPVAIVEDPDLTSAEPELSEEDAAVVG